MWPSILAVSIGAAIGALLRWQLSSKFNSLWALIPAGTLLANLIGAYLIGLALAYFNQNSQLSPEWRLLIITGFCGGLTTFSSFSVEVLVHLQVGRLGWALLLTLMHVLGAVLMTYAGILSWQWLKA